MFRNQRFTLKSVTLIILYLQIIFFVFCVLNGILNPAIFKPETIYDPLENQLLWENEIDTLTSFNSD